MQRPMYQPSFQERQSFQQRRLHYELVQAKHVDKVPIIIERYAAELNLPELRECKFLVHQDTTLAQLLFLVRARLELNPAQTIMLFVNNMAMVSSKTTMRSLQRNFALEDGFVYFNYTSQSTFG